MYWELWDIASKNLVETFDTEDEALQGVRDLLAVNRRDLIDELVLGANYDEDESHDVPLPPSLSGDTLRARLAETAQDASTREAARAVHEKIRRWMAEEGWQIQDGSNAEWPLGFIVTVEGGQTVDVFKHRSHVDRITVAQRWGFDEEIRLWFAKLPDGVRRNVVHEIYRDALILGLNIEDLNESLAAMRWFSWIYFDGLTKDALVQRMLLVVRMYHLIVQAFRRAFAEAGHTAESASNLIQFHQMAGRPQSVAS